MNKIRIYITYVNNDKVVYHNKPLLTYTNYAKNCKGLKEEIRDKLKKRNISNGINRFLRIERIEFLEINS